MLLKQVEYLIEVDDSNWAEMFLSGVGFHTPAFPPGGPETLEMKYSYILKVGLAG